MNYLDVSECTPGEVFIRHGRMENADGDRVEVDSVSMPCGISDRDRQRMTTANTKLLAQSLNVAHLTGKGPKQLADERDALLEAAKAVLSILDHPTNHVTINDSDRLRAAIALTESP